MPEAEKSRLALESAVAFRHLGSLAFRLDREGEPYRGGSRQNAQRRLPQDLEGDVLAPVLDEDVLAGGAALAARDLQILSASGYGLRRNANRDLEVDRLARSGPDPLWVPAPAREDESSLAETEAMAACGQIEGRVLAVSQLTFGTSDRKSVV